MPSVAFNGSNVSQVTAGGHVNIKKWIPSYCNSWDENGNCTGYGGGYYDYSDASAIINGKVQQQTGNVYVNGKPIAFKGSKTTETEDHNIPSGWQSYNSHTSGEGTVVTGNDVHVYVNGKSVAIVGSSVTTHAGVRALIKDGSNNVFIGS